MDWNVVQLLNRFELISNIFIIIGVVILAVGAVGSAVLFVRWQIDRSFHRTGFQLNDVRKFIVERTLLSLDFFVGADLIRTITKLTFPDLGLLAGIVTIRVVLAYFLERELGEKLPD